MPNRAAAVLCAAALVALLPPAEAQAQLPPLTECGPRVHVGETRGVIAFPQGDLFCPLVADPKEPRSFLSYQRGRSPAEAEEGHTGPLAPLDTDIGAVGIGDAFGLVRWAGRRPGDGVQIGLSAGIFAQFDLRTESYDLINADYLVGIPVTVRRGRFSGRLRLYHQSSHLGDEFLIRDQPERINLAFEALELILSQAFQGVRIYGGGEYLFNREPRELESLVARAGAELRFGGRTGGFVAAVDLKSSEEQDWKPATSVRAGVEFGFARDPGHPPRMIRLLGEFYEGPSPYGQFYREQLRYWGAGFHLTL